MTNYTHTQTAKLIRAALKLTYPRTKFAVRCDSYSMGCSIRVSWTDGPLESDVEAVYKPFEDVTFDGMTDCKGYRRGAMYKGEVCRFGGAWVQGSRTTSADLVRFAAYRVAKETRLPLLRVGVTSYGSAHIKDGEYLVPFSYFEREDGSDILCEDSGAREYYSQLVYRMARKIATEQRSWLPELPESLPEVAPEPLSAEMRARQRVIDERLLALPIEQRRMF